VLYNEKKTSEPSEKKKWMQFLQVSSKKGQFAGSSKKHQFGGGAQKKRFGIFEDLRRFLMLITETCRSSQIFEDLAQKTVKNMPLQQKSIFVQFGPS
jgi:hypothetical protein